ncbi:hypothetical protein KY290_001254 [Solanum tuberosum]|uniref:Uncharacterized protein n=1 Tax=Solanum tuberosum TaxID=4113 RepID=A0ABQ7WLK9_SOLTU|nr:hypothetical protein KY290_001254 [Solanum tuberosum]
MTVKNTEIQEHVRRIEAFVGLTDDRLDDPNLVDLLTQFYGMKIEFENFRSEMGLYRADIKEHSAENLSFREAVSLKIDGVMKYNEDLRTQIDKVLKEKEILYAELSILCLAIAGSRTNHHVRDDDQVSITTMYLADDAKLWWCTRMADQVSVEHPKIDLWELLEKELKDQFFPRNAG